MGSGRSQSCRTLLRGQPEARPELAGCAPGLPPLPTPVTPFSVSWVGMETQGPELTFQRGKREAGALEQGVSALLAGGSTGLGAGLGSSTSQRPDLWAKAMGDRGWGGACADDGEGRSGAVGEVGRGLRRGWREGPRAGPTWPVAPSRSGSVPTALPRDSACARPGPEAGPPPARPVPACPALPVASGLACPGCLRPPPSAGSNPRKARRAFPAGSRAGWRWAGASLPSPWHSSSCLGSCPAQRAHLPSHVSP